MKILHCVGSFVNGGVETLLVNLVNQQVKEGYSITIMIVTNRWSNELLNQLDKNIRIININKPIDGKNPWYLLKMLYYHFIINPDIFHLHGPATARLFPFKKKKEKRFVTLHNEVMDMPYHKTVEKYIAISQCVLEAFKRNTGHDNCEVCYNGVDFSKIREKTLYSKRPQRILCIARVLFVTKAQDLVVKAIGQLPDDILNNIHVDFWGDGPDLCALKSIVYETNLEHYVTVSGNVPNDYVNEHLRDYDIIIQASHHEGLGLCAIEAMGAGTPIILSNALGFLEVSEKGKYATMFNHGDANSLADAISYVYNNYSKCCEIAKKACEMVHQKFSIKEYSNQISSIYTKK